MKNIHLLPTEKPSRIRLGNNKNFVIANFEQSSIRSKNDSYTNQHIYITSDSEIKEGDAVIHDFGMGYELENPCDSDNLKSNTRSKIILTTDQDLIADGVQAIDDNFLEWFVKNPSCESVETKVVDFEVDMGLGDECIEHSSYYKIIIPKEEPKQETLTYTKAAKKEERIFNSTMMSKQETLEEAVRIHLDKNKYSSPLTYAKIGAKWQAERMYSEEEVVALLEYVRENFYDTGLKWHSQPDTDYTSKEVLEQFKKK